MTVTTERACEAPAVVLVDAAELALTLGCSRRHIMRMSARGEMPRPLRLGSLVRWNRAAIDAWLSRGCPPVVIGAPAGVA
jgi:excisionase family DNA binding protein